MLSYLGTATDLLDTIPQYLASYIPVPRDIQQMHINVYTCIYQYMKIVYINSSVGYICGAANPMCCSKCSSEDSSGGVFPQEGPGPLHYWQSRLAEQVYSHWPGHGQETARPWLQTAQQIQEVVPGGGTYVYILYYVFVHVHCFYVLHNFQLSKDSSEVLPPQQKGQDACPVIYGPRIYFPASQDARERFMANPECYASVPSPGPAVPIRLAIVGPPKSGKSTGELLVHMHACHSAAWSW